MKLAGGEPGVGLKEDLTPVLPFTAWCDSNGCNNGQRLHRHTEVANLGTV